MATPKTTTPEPVQKPAQDEEVQSAAEMKMQPTEFAELRAEAAALGQQDHRLGHFLTTLVHHLGHAHGLDASTEDARLAAEKQTEQNAATKTEEENDGN